MPLQLNFRIEDRGGVMVLITQAPGGVGEVVRPASAAETELWNALTRRFASPARESYIRVNEQDLVTVIMERDHLRKQVTEQQRRIDELEGARTARATVAPPHDGQGQQPHEAADDRGTPGGEPTP